MKNLLFLHLESISNLILSTHRHCFPNLERLLSESRQYPNYISSATSTLMVLTHLFHGNDFELDEYSLHDGALAHGNNAHLFAILKAHGYHPGLACLNVFHEQSETRLSAWPETISTPFGSDDTASVMAALDDMTSATPFAVFFWNLLSHIEHSGVYAYHAASLTDRLQSAYRQVDAMIGELLRRLHEKNVLNDTVIVIYGDHGDDFWSHGFKGGMVHALEPYANLVWTPMAIWQAGRDAGSDQRMSSTVDLRATCLEILGVEHRDTFPWSGRSLLGPTQRHVFSQNFMANQPDNAGLDITRCLAVYNDTYCLLASNRGLEMYAYRLDPTNRCNLLYFYESAPDGGIRLRDRPNASAHYLSALREGEAISHSIALNFSELRVKLAERIAAKQAYLAERLEAEQIATWSADILDRFESAGRAGFYNERPAAPAYSGFRFS